MKDPWLDLNSSAKVDVPNANTTKTGCLYFSGMWLGVDQRTNIKKTYV